jgi:histone acetyltransferase 1
VKRIQICVLFYIEGGSYIGEDAEGKEEPEYSLARWSVYFLYKKQAVPDAESKNQYIFHGYSTVYNFWLYELPTPPSTPGKEPIQPKTDNSWEMPAGDLPYEKFPHRARISQFVILPPFQGKGIGAMLYNAIFELQSKDVSTKEITVEDPNEAFDLLRDICDLKYLCKNVPEFANLTVNPEITVPQMGGVLHNNLQVSLSEGTSASSAKGIVDIAALESLRVSVKIAPRQFARLVEIHLMSKLPDSVRPQSESSSKSSSASKADKHIYTLWRLLLKQRLYRRNATILGEFETTERIIKLNETLENVEWEYARILERVEGSKSDDTTAELPATNGNSNGKGKRKSDDEGPGYPLSKKARVEDVEESG